MVKFDQLKLDQLKKELSKYDLPTSGNKAELQKRLMDEFQRQGLDIDSHEFECKDELELSNRSMASGIDFNSMFAAMMEKLQEVKEDSRTNSEKLLEKNEKMMTEMETKLLEKNEKMMETKFQETSKILTEIETKLEGISESTNKQLQEISSTINNRIDGVEGKFDKKLADVVEKCDSLDKKYDDLEAKVNDIQHQGGPVRIVQETSGKTKTPSFDGSLPFNVFKFQFETVAERNLWDNDQKALELILALKGNAAEVLESVPLSSRKNFDDIMSALQRKYGGEHKKEIYRLELRGRVQKPNETLQDFALDIERLVELIYPGENQTFLDQFKIEAFVNGIRDPDIKFAVCATRKPTFAETVSFALAQETAKIIAKPQVYKVRGVDVVPENQNCVEQMKEAVRQLTEIVRQLLDEKNSRLRTKCDNCGKIGHWQRNCRAPRRLDQPQLAANRDRHERRGLASTSNGPTVSTSVIQRKNSNLTTRGCINGQKHVFTIDTGASCSIIRSDLVRSFESLSGLSLRTVTGEPATVYGKVKVKVTMANMSVNHVFIVADIADEVIIGVDFLSTNGISLHLGSNTMMWRNAEIPLDIGYEGRSGDRQAMAFERHQQPENVIDVRTMHVDSNKDWAAAQRKDPVLSKMIAAKEENKRPSRAEISLEGPVMKSYWALWDSLKVIDGCLYRTWESADGKTVKNLLVVPSSKIKEVLKEFHGGPGGGHRGVARTLEKLKQWFYWIGCPQNVAEWIAKCPQCSTAKGTIRSSSDQQQQHNSGALYERKGGKMKARYDRAANSNGFSEGQLVLLYNPQRRRGLSPKLPANWDGPYKVVKRINDVVYRIQKHKSPRSKMKVVHLERLAAYGRREAVPIRDEQA